MGGPRVSGSRISGEGQRLASGEGLGLGILTFVL